MILVIHQIKIKDQEAQNIEASSLSDDQAACNTAWFVVPYVIDCFWNITLRAGAVVSTVLTSPIHNKWFVNLRAPYARTRWIFCPPSIGSGRVWTIGDRLDWQLHAEREPLIPISSFDPVFMFHMVEWWIYRVERWNLYSVLMALHDRLYGGLK